jgi:protein-S-isoprenylcysteine O-methyltransferase Ste14
MKVAAQLVASALSGVLFLGVLLFGPAGTLAYGQGWVYIAVFTVGTSLPTTYLAVRYPDAMRRRMRAGPLAESRPAQKLVTVALLVVVAVVLVISALDHRFGWSTVPPAAVVLGNVLVLGGLAVAELVIVQNNYAAATITVERDQPLVSTGLYGFVRHPMYFGALVMMIGTPPALDSWWGLLAALPLIAVFAARIVDEEALLRADLPGYADYTQRVRYRLLPGVW